MFRRLSSSVTLLWVVVPFVAPLPLLAAFELGGSGLTPGVGFGIIAYTWMLAAVYLASRPRWADRRVGLPHLYMVHGLLAVAAVLVAWAHGALSQAVGLSATLGVAALLLMTVLVACALLFMAGWLSQRVRWVASLRRRLEGVFSHEVSVRAHLLLLVAVLLVFAHVLSMPYIRENAAFTALLVAATAVSLGCFVLGRVARRVGTVSATVESATPVAERTTELVLALAPGTRYRWRAGDFTFIRFPELRGMSEFHPFSMVSAPAARAFNGGRGRLVFNIRADGDFTRAVASLPVGAKAVVLPSYGRYRDVVEAHPAGAPLVMIAGGIGVTPLLSLLAAYVGSGRPIAFLYGARSDADMVHATELRALAAAHPNLHLVLRAGGRLEEDEVASQMRPDSVYLIAGPYLMQRAWRSFLAQRGVDADDVYYEPFAM